MTMHRQAFGFLPSIPQTFSNADKPQSMKSLCEFGSYRLDLERRLLLQGDEPVQLPAKALDTLVALIQRRGEVVSKDDLMKAVWPDSFVEEANLSQNIFILRKALGETAQDHRYIVTVPGRGYRFIANVREISEDRTKRERIKEVISWFVQDESRPEAGWWSCPHWQC
jgi:DNA-binding winged helix-turn-helix (wHTH) protein